jgi:hypothetical protein
MRPERAKVARKGRNLAAASKTRRPRHSIDARQPRQPQVNLRNGAKNCFHTMLAPPRPAQFIPAVAGLSFSTVAACAGPFAPWKADRRRASREAVRAALRC